MFKRSVSFSVLCFISSHCAMLQALDIPDPTKPLGYSSAKSTAQQLQLQAIFFGDDRKEAIVSGILVREGDKAHGRRVISIGKDRISLRSASGSETLYLRASIFSQ